MDRKLSEIKKSFAALNNGDFKPPWKWGVQKRTKGDGECGDNEFALGDLISPIDEKSSNTILEIQTNKYGQPEIYGWDETAADFIVNAPEYIWYLLYLLEKKNNTLKRIADLHVRGIEDRAADLHRMIAQDAVIESEGDVIG
ncbi:hypothetical protein D3C80_1345210 [compost metagenome]